MSRPNLPSSLDLPASRAGTKTDTSDVAFTDTVILIDYAHRRRIKVWGTARVVEGEEALLRHVMPEGYRARPEQVVRFTVTAWDVICPQHIPQRFEAADVEAAIRTRDQRIAVLEAEVERLRTSNVPPASRATAA